MKYTLCIVTLAWALLSCNEQNESQPASSTKKIVTETPAKVNKKAIKTVSGVDVSHFQGDVNWGKVKQDGVLFAYTKATQGAHYTDPMYTTNWKNMASNGMYKGAYHFYVYDDNALDQANHFLKTVTYSKGDLPPVLDLEEGGVDGHADVATYHKDVLLWLNTVEKALGVKPIIYTNFDFGNTYLNLPEFGKYNLWLAEYTKEKPEVPKAWQAKGWLIWQHSQTGEIEGIKGSVDCNKFNGDFQKLKHVLVN